MKILLAGCGEIGLALADKLNGQHDFIGLKRSPIVVDFPIFTANLADPNSLVDLPTNFDVILYTATPDSRDETNYRQAIYQGVENLLAHFQATQPYFIFISSTAVYGQNKGEWVDENSPTEPKRFNGQILVETEQLLLNNHQKSLILRLSGIYAENRLALFKRALTGMTASKDFPGWSNRIHFADVIACLSLMLEKIEQHDKLDLIYNLTDSLPVSYWDVYSYIANTCHTPPPINSDESKVSGKKVSNKKLIDLGYKFIYPDYKKGYQSIITPYLKQTR